MSKGSDGYGSSPAMNSFSVGAHFAHSGPLAKWPSSVSISKYLASTPARVSLSITAGAMDEGKSSGYGSRWKKWLLVYVAVGAVAYLVVYLVFFHHGGGGY